MREKKGVAVFRVDVVVVAVISRYIHCNSASYLKMLRTLGFCARAVRSVSLARATVANARAFGASPAAEAI